MNMLEDGFVDKFISSRFNFSRSEKSKIILDQFQASKENFERIIQKSRKSSTTVFAIKYKDGVVIAGDRRTSDGYFGVASDTTVKVRQLSKFSAMASSGFCNVIEETDRQMKQELKSFLDLYGKEVSPDGQARYLSTILDQWWFLMLMGIPYGIGAPILAAYDVFFETPRIFWFDVDGYFMEVPFFGGTGCGFSVIQNLVIDRWKENMTRSQTVDLAIRAMIHSGRASHGVSEATITPPTVAIIDKSGFRWIPKEIIEAGIKNIYGSMEGLKCLLKTNQ